MPPEITTITNGFVLNVVVNCYLVKENDAFFLIDTGMPRHRRAIERALAAAGCQPAGHQPGNLKLIILTHGDVDHSGNAAYLRGKYGARIAMHPDDAGMVERGDMFWNRQPPNLLVKGLFSLLLGLKPPNRFTPDIALEEGADLSAYGLAAQVLHLPGHAAGHIGILTESGDLLCGDLLANVGKPEIWSIVDDQAAMHNSAARLKNFAITNVYPGHGKPFPMAQFEPDGNR